MNRKSLRNKFGALLGAFLITLLCIQPAAAATTLNFQVKGLSASYEGDKVAWIADVNTSGGVLQTNGALSGAQSKDNSSTLTIENNSGKDGVIEFTIACKVTAGDSGAKWSKDSYVKLVKPDNTEITIVTQKGEVTADPYTIDLPKDKAVKVELLAKGKKVSGVAGSVQASITGIKFTPKNIIDVTFCPSTNGSYTVDGKTIAEEWVDTRDATKAFVLRAVPEAGYQFSDWYDTTNGRTLSTKQECDLTVDRSCNIMARFLPAGTATYSVGDQLFVDLDAAATYALNNNQSKITLVSSGTITGQHTIPAGVTLLIPHDEAGTLYTAKPEYTTTSETQKAYRTLTMAPGSSITVNGAISVGGKHYAGSAGSCCKTTGSYGQIIMQEGSAITLNNDASLYAWGYITGDGIITANSGAKVYEYFQIADWRGGNATNDMRQGTLKDDHRVFPFSQYYVQNIEAALTICSGAKEIAYASITASNTTMGTALNFIGDSSCLFSVETGGSLTKKYDPTTDRMVYTSTGAAALGHIVISFKLAGIIEADVDSSDYVLPVNGNTTLNVTEGSVFTVGYDAALLPGTQVNIERGGELCVAAGRSLYVYDQDQWGGYCCSDNSKFKSVAYSPTKKYTRTEADLVDAKIDVNGNIIVNGAMYTTKSGADICSSEGTGVYKQVAAPGTATITYQAKQSSNQIESYPEIPITPAKLHNADGTYTETTGKPAQTTINYILGMWGGTPATVTFDANGGTGTMTDQAITSFNTPLNACAFTRLGYTFAGWKTNPDDPGIKYTDQQEISPKSGDSLTLYAQWTENTYTITVKSDASGSSIADVSLDGPGTGYKITEWGDKQITIIAPEKQGFTFTGWYKSDSETLLSPDLVVAKSLTELLPFADSDNRISLVAVYESKGETNLTLTLKGAPSGVTVLGSGVDQIGTTNTWSVPVGTEVTITVPDSTGFQYWTNANDKVMSKDPTYTFTMVTNTTLTAVTSTSTPFVIFQSADERLLKADTLDSITALPDAPYRVGYKFAGWKVGNKTVSTAQEITADMATNGVVTVTAVYEEITEEQYTVTASANVDDVTITNADTNKDKYALGDIATFTAPAASDGSSFRFWASDAKGTNILSFSTTYSFRVTKDTTIYAIYGGEAVTDRPPVVRVDNVLANQTDQASSLTFMIGASIPKDYQLVEMGALYAKDVASGDDTTLRVENVDNSAVYKAVSRLKHEDKLTDYSYALGFNMTKNPDTTIYLRGYVAVKKAGDSADSTIYYYYSGVTSKSYSTANSQGG